eukprot:3544502-Rhodomonas_salina.1
MHSAITGAANPHALSPSPIASQSPPPPLSPPRPPPPSLPPPTSSPARSFPLPQCALSALSPPSLCASRTQTALAAA